jgi:AcrR family transcriptional regulator
MPRSIARDHEDKRARILTIAAQLFAAQGYSQASMAQVSQACGISKANIYHYYPSKAALLFDILRTYLGDLRDKVCGLDGAGRDPSEQLYALTLEILLAYEGMDPLHKIQTECLHLLPEEQQEVLRGYQRDMVRALSGGLLALAPEAFAADRERLHHSTMSIFGMLNWFYMWNGGADATARQAYARLVTDMVVGGVNGPRTPPTQSH